MILVIWLCGVGVITLLRSRDWRRIGVAVRVSTPIEIPAPVEVRSSPGLLEPGVVGLLRPILLLPEGISDRLTSSQLEAVLAHELCHVRRRDNLFALLHMVVETLFWFHPLVWWIGARMVEERERACDEEVLSMGNQPRAYADAILSVCKLYTESPLVCVPGVSGANIRRRIEAIMSNSTGMHLNRAKKLLLAGAGTVAVVGPIVLGVLVGMGHVPAIQAQSRAIPPAEQEGGQLAQAAPSQVAPRAQAATVQQISYQDRRLVAMLFDMDTMTPDEQLKARQSAADYVRNMKPADLMTVMAAYSGKVKVLQDFTDDYAALQSVIGAMDMRQAATSAPGTVSRLSNITTAANILAVFPEKKRS